MHKLVSQLVVYRNLPADNLLEPLAAICAEFAAGDYNREELTAEIYEQVHKLLDIGTVYGFDKNLWHNYLAFLLVSCENPFAITCEKVGACDGSVNQFAKHDFKIFQQLFAYDFSELERALEINCFSLISNYQAVVKQERRYNKNISDKVQALSTALEGAADADEFFACVTKFYHDYGVGKLGLNKAFRIAQAQQGAPELVPISNTEQIIFADLIGYEDQKKRLLENTEAFVAGRPANNVLLFGDSGTGKSSSIKALINKYYDQGLRMIEIYKHQFGLLSQVIAKIKNRNYRFMIFIDDLSFEEHEVEYKFLKAVIEGGVETRPANVLIVATSNRRHLVQDTWKDRDDMEHNGDIHRSDTMEEKLSLAARFGCAICYVSPNRQQYHDIVKGIAARLPDGLTLTEDELLQAANRWEIRHGGISGRTAQQFINYIAGLQT